jgi:hypothetical protein
VHRASSIPRADSLTKSSRRGVMIAHQGRITVILSQACNVNEGRLAVTACHLFLIIAGNNRNE